MKILKIIVIIINIMVWFALLNPKPRYSYKAKESEAKIQFAGARAGLKIFYGDFGFYAPCLRYMGYDPSLEVDNRYFAIGFKSFDIDENQVKKILKLKKFDDDYFKTIKENCLTNPTHFYQNGRYQKVTLADFPDEAKVTLDKNGKSSFKLFAVGITPDGYKSVYSIDENNMWQLHGKSWAEQYRLKSFDQNIFTILKILIFFQLFLFIFVEWLYLNKYIIYIEGVLVSIFALVIIYPQNHFFGLILVTLAIEALLIFIRTKLLYRLAFKSGKMPKSRDV